MENKDLQEITRILIDLQAKMEASFSKTSKEIAEARQETADAKREIMTYIESSVERDIKTIAEGVTTLVNHEPSIDKVDQKVEDLGDRVLAVEYASKEHRKELDELQKAQ